MFPFTRLKAEVLAVEIADCVRQGPRHYFRECSRGRSRPVQLPSNDKLRVLGPLPPQGCLKAAEIDGVDRFLRTQCVEQPDLERSRAIDRACDCEGFLQR